MSGEAAPVKEPERHCVKPACILSQCGPKGELLPHPFLLGRKVYREDQGLNKRWSLAGTSEVPFMDLASIKGDAWCMAH